MLTNRPTYNIFYYV